MRKQRIPKTVLLAMLLLAGLVLLTCRPILAMNAGDAGNDSPGPVPTCSYYDPDAGWSDEYYNPDETSSYYDPDAGWSDEYYDPDATSSYYDPDASWSDHYDDPDASWSDYDPDASTPDHGESTTTLHHPGTTNYTPPGSEDPTNTAPVPDQTQPDSTATNPDETIPTTQEAAPTASETIPTSIAPRPSEPVPSVYYPEDLLDLDSGAARMLEATKEWYMDSLEDAVFRSDAPFEYFYCVLMDGVRLEPDCYDLSKGSIKVTLKAWYLKTMTEGDHKLEIVSETETGGKISAVAIIKIKGAASQKTETETPTSATDQPTPKPSPVPTATTAAQKASTAAPKATTAALKANDPAPKTSDTLPRTGMNNGHYLVLASVMLIVGGLLAVILRKRTAR
ncbi:MAG: LPXTG cell wall anchor domain-containing protein [Bacillota bacterium]|nr:LPXTG cell wall anchor domain-containing protein [Bacillota bacterium]